MTSVETMLMMRSVSAIACRLSAGAARCIAPFGLFLSLLILSGCDQRVRLDQPAFLHAPYAETQLFAVVPFMNESGVSGIDTASVADRFTEQLQDVDGIVTVPVNRVIRAMRELEMDSVRTPADARMLLTALDVDGLIVGTISAWNAYHPPKVAAAIELHMQSRGERYATIDTRSLTRSPAGEAMPGAYGPQNPIAQASGVYDAANHRTLAQLRDYTRGRHIPESAFGEDIFLVRMDLYTQFVSFRLIHDLLAVERARLAQPEYATDVAQARDR
jgi:hypothetical protein